MKNLLKISGLILTIFLLSCSEKRIGNEDGIMICGTKDPVNDLKWLNAEFKLFHGGKDINAIVLYEFNGREVIEVQNSIFSSTNMHQYYCNGERLKLEEPGKFDEFKKNRIEKKIIYGTKMW
ncbi:hypothetical protein [Dyadobacter sp. CY312]|uniref:hypothetical protein n=1 Tax=Dyadobacter sp. CY312 TaxID=2907303 RepID=UPI001F4338BA|nr:hypothetical protein [Dyadobacter sp. CY312]MCE7040035.1 hypothetical protein [Dyadobacter sp. CY312]